MAKKTTTKAGTVKGRAKASVDEYLAGAEPEVGGGGYNLPIGDYEGFFVPEKARILVDRNGDTRALVVVQVDDEDHPELTEKEKKGSTNYQLNHDRGAGFFQGLMQMAELGHPNSKKEAAACLEQLDNMRCAFSVRQGKDEYTNLYINEVFTELDGDGQANAGDEQDYVALGQAVDKNGDESAEAILTAAAKEAGLDPDDYGTWEALGADLAG